MATPSACEIHRAWIESQVTLGRNAMSIYQDLVERYGFTHRYNSVKRFVATLKAREPERFDVLEFLPGEEAQVDYGQGALTRLANGKYRRPYLFVMTLKYSGKSFRKVVWKTSQESLGALHEEAFRTFGGRSRYVVLDNLKRGRAQARSVRAGFQPGLRRDARALWRRRRSVPRRGPESQGHRRERDPAHPGHGAEGPQVRVDRGAERVARALGGALGGAAHPRTQETPGARDVRRGEAGAQGATGDPLPLLPRNLAHRR